MNTTKSLHHFRNVLLLIAALSFPGSGFCEDKDPICGKWKWISGAVHQFGPNGHVVGEKGCTWKRIEGGKRPTYIITWKTDYVDTLHLIKGGTELRGKNNEGNEVWGTRLADSPPPLQLRPDAP
jgi:hypothetical protein